MDSSSAIYPPGLFHLMGRVSPIGTPFLLQPSVGVCFPLLRAFSNSGGDKFFLRLGDALFFIFSSCHTVDHRPVLSLSPRVPEGGLHEVCNSFLRCFSWPSLVVSSVKRISFVLEFFSCHSFSVPVDAFFFFFVFLGFSPLLSVCILSALLAAMSRPVFKPRSLF